MDITQDTEVSQFLDQLLPELDRQLAAAGIPVGQRNWPIAHMIVNEKIVHFVGEPNTDFLNSFGFGFVLRMVESWYQRAYGSALKKSSESQLAGLVRIRQELYELSFPRFVRLEDDENGNFRMKLATSIEPIENPVDFLIDAPPFTYMDAERQHRAQQEICDVVCQIRALWSHITTLDGPQQRTQELSGALLYEIDRLPKYAAPFSKRNIGRFYEALRLCCELALKLKLLQVIGEFQEVHNFDRLTDRLGDQDRTVIHNGIPKQLWHYRTVSELRYGKYFTPSIKSTFTLYRETIGFLAKFTSHLKRRANVDNAIFIMRKPIWADATFELGPSAEND